jgi:hypothetical protein
VDNQLLVALLIVAAVLFLILVWISLRRRRGVKLRQRFGPEYERAVAEHGDRRQAESALEARERRVKELDIRSLSSSDRERFAQSWRSVQAQFVDDPGGAIQEADRLVGELMRGRGYPVGDFEERAADISVDHPHVIENYRAAHDIALRQHRAQADTEDLRKAMVHYRSLFEELLETTATEREQAQR